MQLSAVLATLFSVLVPAKMWYAPTQPLNVTVKGDGAFTLVLTDFAGKPQEAQGSAEVAGGKEVDVKSIFPAMARPGAYILYAVPKGKPTAEFAGTPLVIQVRYDKRPQIPDPTMVTRVEPLSYAVLTVEQGDMTMIFWYDVAPITVNNFLTLGREGYFDGLTFHRIVPGFVLQGGDPRGDGMGGPGYHIEAEFNDRKHEEGVLSMARTGDPLERSGMAPRPEFANSAGSQFFICLAATEHLDNKYTAFGKVVEGLEAVRALAKVPIVDPRSGKPEKPPVIKKVEVRPVTADKNPYRDLLPRQ